MNPKRSAFFSIQTDVEWLPVMEMRLLINNLEEFMIQKPQQSSRTLSHALLARGHQIFPGGMQ